MTTQDHREAFESMVSKCYPNFADFSTDEDGDYYDEALIDMHRGWILHARFTLEQRAMHYRDELEKGNG